MKKRIGRLPISIMLIVLLTGLLACEDHQARFEDPPWLGGDNIEVLEEMGNYSIYLELMERAGYKDPVSKISYTLFVPSDSMFQAYFEKNGIMSVDELTDDEVFQLFTLHLLINPRTRYQLIYEFVWGEEQGPQGEYASLFFRKQTPSQSTPYQELPQYPKKSWQEDTINIYTNSKFVPLWSKDYFEDIFGAPDGSDYLFFYPNSQWDVSSDIAHLAMNWHNAMVLPNPDDPTEMGIKTSSGFIYLLDQVVEPMPSIEEYMRDNLDKYGLFYKLMQRYADYGNSRTAEVQVGDDIVRQTQYRKTYSYIADVADDHGPSGLYAQFRFKDMFTAYIPTNDVLQNYLDNNILNTYGDIDSIPDITMTYLLRSHLNNSLGLISKLENGSFNDFGEAFTVTREMINSGFMCSNGPLYEMNTILVPGAFESVTGDLFFNKNYSTFLFALNSVDLLTEVSDPEQEVTLFAASNDALESANIRYNNSDEVIEYMGPDNVWRTMKTDQLTEWVKNHIVYEKITDLTGEGFLETSSGNYIYYNNGVIQGPENQWLGDYVNVTGVQKETDLGINYLTDNAIKSRYYSIGKLLHNNTEDPKQAETLTDTTLTLFSELLEDCRFLNRRVKDSQTRELTPSIKFAASSDKWTVFAPTNQAIREARAAGLIPESRDSLEAFCAYHFVRDNVVFDDGNPEGTGEFPTHLEEVDAFDEPYYVTLFINNDAKNMTVTDRSGQVITVAHEDANMLAQKAVVHKINTILKY